MPFTIANQCGGPLDPTRTSRFTVFSYIFDWIVIVALAAVGGILYMITGNQHAFSLDDPAISYPLRSDTFSITMVGILAFAVPAATIMLLSLTIPTSTILATRASSSSQTPWKRRLWEWHTGWLGLSLSLAGAFFVVSGLKDIVGKPRPDFLARCDPDLANISAHLAGGGGLHRTGAPILVYPSICQNQDTAVVKDGFAAFPSGHSSFAWAGLLYLSLWLAAKFAIVPPAWSHGTFTSQNSHQAPGHAGPRASVRPAAPPLYLLFLTSTPVCLALCISATRYSDYMHAGWDITSASLIGIFFACLGFRWYHVLAAGDGQSSGWAFAARSGMHAFWMPYGSRGYTEGVDSSGYEDLEMGPVRG
ncbi:hypothetical protein BDW74DRAFT_177968 [Aspergillus multicolor]|uniref:phosphatase PAP2 family protein n=1 Tax=Aspergillus multicolor TaxID=41759 RepID=UPI003CCD345F